MPKSDPRVIEIRNILDRIADVEQSDNDTKEIVYDAELAKIKGIELTEILNVVIAAVGKSRKRRRYAPFVYAELSDVPGIEKTFADLLETSDDVGRSQIIQTIGHRKMRSLIPVLNAHFAKEADDFCRDQLLWALGRLADESSLPIFEYLMRERRSRDEWRVLCAGTNYARNEFDAYMQAVFDSRNAKKTHKIMAAWGLAKLGHENAYRYLVSMLDDPETTIKTESTITYDPGEATRAAQAICDIHGWDFEWNKAFVDVVKDRLS